MESTNNNKLLELNQQIIQYNINVRIRVPLRNRFLQGQFTQLMFYGTTRAEMITKLFLVHGRRCPVTAHVSQIWVTCSTPVQRRITNTASMESTNNN